MDCVRLLIDAGADKEAKTNVRVGRWLSKAHFSFRDTTSTLYLSDCDFLTCTVGCNDPFHPIYMLSMIAYSVLARAHALICCVFPLNRYVLRFLAVALHVMR